MIDAKSFTISYPLIFFLSSFSIEFVFLQICVAICMDLNRECLAAESSYLDFTSLLESPQSRSFLFHPHLQTYRSLPIQIFVLQLWTIELLPQRKGRRSCNANGLASIFEGRWSVEPGFGIFEAFHREFELLGLEVGRNLGLKRRTRSKGAASLEWWRWRRRRRGGLHCCQ